MKTAKTNDWAKDWPVQEDVPVLPNDIVFLREKHLGMNQQEFAKLLGASQAAVSAWERGEYEPPADIYAQMGNLSDRPSAFKFWSRARIDPRRLVSALGLLLKMHGVPATPDQVSQFPELESSAEVLLASAAKILRVEPEEVVKMFESGKIKGRRIEPAGVYLLDYDSLIDAARAAMKQGAAMPTDKKKNRRPAGRGKK